MHFLQLVIAAAIFAANPVSAGPFEDGAAAYKRQDYGTALKLFRPLATKGDADLQLILGNMYDNGQGVPKDDQQAVYWYRKAADQGNASAQFNLALNYEKGLGVPKDDQQAVYWFRKAADQGNASAQFNLGNMYDNGQGVPKDDQQGYFWWLLASVGGDTDAKKLRDAIESVLTPQQRAAAQADARNWKPR